MNIARDKTTGREVEADELRLMYEVDQDNYECVDKKCRIKLIPASYRPTNKNRPHFKTPKGVFHKDNCEFSEYLELLKKGKTQRVSFGKVPYPAKLVKSKTAVARQETSEDTSGTTNDGSGRKVTRADGWEENENSSRSVNSLNQIIDFYLSCPYNRDFELDILGYSMEYQYWFKKVEFKRPNDGELYKGRRIFIGTLSLSKDSVKQNGKEIVVRLMECRDWRKPLIRFFNESRKVQVDPYLVKIDVSALSSNKATRLINQLNFIKNEHLEDFKNKTNDNKVQAKIFFLADPPKDTEPYTFHVIDGYLVSRYCTIPKTVSE